MENSEIDLSTIYGVNFRSVVNNPRYFHVIGGMPGVAMHDVLEGILQYETKEYCIREEQLLALSQLNENIKSFDFGYMNDSNKPSPIAPPPPKTLASKNNAVKQKGN